MGHFIQKDNQTVSFCADHSPVLEVRPGTVVTFETGDEGYERLSQGERIEHIGIEMFNVVTGPVSVHGACSEDALARRADGR
ncbi:MAG TPA: hypothetical protein DIU35_08190 [Candidatus Latescibacteria bacterium]|nr:hypothetical protein [Gemmatimonadota bacterium]HCR17448.1 hypothetical protein [Candidatus Latescibacterota bacterium]